MYEVDSDCDCKVDMFSFSGEEDNTDSDCSDEDPLASQSEYQPSADDLSSDSDTCICESVQSSPVYFLSDCAMLRPPAYPSLDTQPLPIVLCPLSPIVSKKGLKQGSKQGSKQSSKKGSKQGSKKHSCKYCRKLNTKMSTHLQRRHRHEIEVAQILKLRKNDPQRRQAFIR